MSETREVSDAGALLSSLGYERRECIELWVKDADPYEIRILSGTVIGWHVEVWDDSLEGLPMHVEGQSTTSLASAIAIADRIVATDRVNLGDSIYRDLDTSA